MPETNPENLETDNPEDYNYISARNYARKQNIQNGQGNVFEQLIGRPGPITGIIFFCCEMAKRSRTMANDEFFFGMLFDSNG